MLAKLDTKTFVSNKANVKSPLANMMCLATHICLFKLRPK